MSTRDQADETPLEPRVGWATLGRLGPALITLVLVAVLPYLSPALEWARPWTPDDPLPFWNLVGRPFDAAEQRERDDRAAAVEAFAREALGAPPPRPAPQPTPDAPPGVEPAEGPAPYLPRPEDERPAQQSIELFAGDELDPFLAALARSDAGDPEAVTRVVHWGDSAIGMDGIPGAIRARMQARFGDAGHGFHLMTPPNTSYRHGGVRFRTNGEWSQCFIIENCKKDGRYGLGGSVATGYPGAESRFAPNARQDPGGVDRFQIWYSAEPRGGRLRYRVDRGAWQEIDTRVDGEQPEDRVETIELDGEAHGLTVRVAGGRVRAYGVTMERDGPGVVWDSAALVGAFTRRMDNFDLDHLRGQLAHREASLLVLTFGGNDMIRERLTMERYTEEYRAVLVKVRAARPEAGCLVMAPLDHGVRRGARIESLPVVAGMVEAQRAAARAEGCAFFDTVAAMGGEGSAGRWYRSDPRLMSGDLGHATAKGHVVIGELLFRALMEQYVAYRRREAGEAGAEG